jgi:hypothetical protein
LWQCWEGEGYFSNNTAELIYFTLGEVDCDNDLVRRALASSLQRDGVVDSLSDGFRIIENSVALQGFVGLLPDEREYTVCDSEGQTEYGDTVDEAINATWIEISD